MIQNTMNKIINTTSDIFKDFFHLVHVINPFIQNTFYYMDFLTIVTILRCFLQTDIQWAITENH
jgi:hypothetical protein